MKRIILIGLLLPAFAGCGGGAGGVSNSNSALLEIATRAQSSETVVYAVEMTVRLPAGVTVEADPATGEVAAGSIQAKVPGAQAAARFQPATATVPGTVKINVVDPSGFTVGALAALSCRLSSGAAPTGADFAAQTFSVRDANGLPLEGVYPGFTFKVQ